MRIIGDVHGKIKQYLALLEGVDSSLQLGDMGIGFSGVSLPEMEKHKFIRGNHDNPTLCRKHPNYAGDYTYWPDLQLFLLGGAWSIDQNMRVEGVSWWRDEELSYTELLKAQEFYISTQPKIVITHDCPEVIGEMLLNRLGGFGGATKFPTRTGKALQSMWMKWKPELWIFGHYHAHFDKTVLGTRFVCLNELEYMDI